MLDDVSQVELEAESGEKAAAGDRDPEQGGAPAAMSAEVAFYRPTPKRLKARRIALGLAIVFYVGGIAATFGVSIAHGRGTGFNDGGLVASCNTPGGPYYPPDLPVAERNCPQGTVGRAQSDDTGPIRDPWDVLRILVSLGLCALVLWGWIQTLELIGTI